jgi:hypothetical protein
MKAVSILSLALSLACSRSGGQSEPPPQEAGRAEYRGKIVITGSEQATSVRLVGEAGNVELSGALQPELRRLAGAGVLARGSLHGTRPAQTLEVSDYEVTEIDGARPATGVLKSAKGKLWLTGRDTMELVGAPEVLREKDGAKIWVVGDRAGNTLTVGSYGIIAEGE